ncbi:MAG: histidinol-phosphate transaminase [Betaproteobacteria bacterium TMED22]|nr:MAG: histidinol-phosphate transaminase [Betaproteobacteria bacterium TMED22]|tara:strand:- start:11914 stop:12978 length:1065 start_codon:yes stop_codon:yes gene_type:complete
MSRFWSDLVSRLNPYVPGEQTESKSVTKLNTNESPFGPSERVIEAISKCVGEDLRLYPDPRSLALRDAIATVEGVSNSNVFVGNGSDEVLAHTFQAFFNSNKPILFPDITYSFYPSYCRLFDLSYEQIPLNDNFVINVDSYSKENGGVILPNPNAPTGIDLGLAAIRKLLENQSKQVVVIDEAYVDFGAQSAAKLLGEFPNLLVTRSFSKSYALAGLRVGYALGQAELIEGLHRVKDSFNSYPVDRLATAGAIAAVQDRDYLDVVRRKIASNREQLISGLTALDFLVLPSATNFVFARHETISATTLNQELRKVDILVRHFTRPVRIEQFLRITVGTEAMVHKLLKSLKLILRH